MHKMKISTYILLASLIIALTLNQCKKCNTNKNLGELNFTQTDLDIVPYDGNENMIFKNDYNDSIDFSGIRRESTFNNYTFITMDYVEDDHCGPNYYLTERNHTSFTAQHSSYIKIEIGLHTDIDCDSIKQSIFYTKNEGLVGFKTNDGRIWHKSN